MTNGKGSSRRKGENFRRFSENWDVINWGTKHIKRIYCDNCGIIIENKDIETRPELFIFNLDNTISHKSCNFN